VDVFGVKLVGIGPDTGKKALFTLVFLLVLWLVREALHRLIRVLMRGRVNARARFWAHQSLNLAAAFLLLLGVLSLWFNQPRQLTTVFGLLAAGLAFALQRVVTALAGYVVLLRGKTFNMGDRISMGGVRGDVIALDFIQTTILEMGQPPEMQRALPPSWVKSRQYTGRIVTITNDKIFDEPVYNYTREFPYVWEEMDIPIPYAADRACAERILLECAEHHTMHISDMSQHALAAMQRRYNVRHADLEPKVYYRITDNWLELTVRFVVDVHGIRDLKDAMSRDILTAFDAAGIGIASATYDVVGLPTLRVAGVEDGTRVDRH